MSTASQLSPADLLRLCDLRQKIAYESAVSDLDSYAVFEFGENDDDVWMDLQSGLQDVDALPFLVESLELLRLMGCLEFRPGYTNWVKVKPMSEARA